MTPSSQQHDPRGRATGNKLIDGVLELADRLRPLHLVYRRGDPLVRYRELEPQFVIAYRDHASSGHAFRPPRRQGIPHMNVVV